MAEEEKRELSSEEIVQIVQNQAAQIDQLNLMVKDLGGKVKPMILKVRRSSNGYT